MTGESITTINNALEVVVTSYRLGMEGQASEHLVHLIDILGTVLREAPQELIQEINPILSESLGAIERKDYLWAADMFEYEIGPLLHLLMK